MHPEKDLNPISNERTTANSNRLEIQLEEKQLKNLHLLLTTCCCDWKHTSVLNVNETCNKILEGIVLEPGNKKSYQFGTEVC